MLGKVRLGLIRSALDSPAACAAAIEAAGAPVYALIHLAGLFEKDAMEPDDHGGLGPRHRRQPDERL